MPKLIDLIPAFRPSREEYFSEGSWFIRVKPPEIVGGGWVEIELNENQYERYRMWRDGSTPIQMLLPELTLVQREMIMTGLSPSAQERTFRKEDE